ncbi:hypothetical protein IQ07DRAFT_648688 [Pyrenochaeta sp. DS3sAY3a]|nr:hypothetical protein IQ07DRAFT_648688 [Pyrenochaeta sp. DS3sAY3a]
MAENLIHHYIIRPAWRERDAIANKTCPVCEKTFDEQDTIVISTCEHPVHFACAWDQYENSSTTATKKCPEPQCLMRILPPPVSMDRISVRPPQAMVTCPICHNESHGDFIVTRCQFPHRFCVDCLKAWAANVEYSNDGQFHRAVTNPTCPTCRTGLDLNKFSTLISDDEPENVIAIHRNEKIVDLFGRSYGANSAVAGTARRYGGENTNTLFTVRSSEKLNDARNLRYISSAYFGFSRGHWTCVVSYLVAIPNMDVNTYYPSLKYKGAILEWDHEVGNEALPNGAILVHDN